MLEDELVARIVNTLWRLQRVPAFEAALLAVLEQEQEEEEDYSVSYEATEDEAEGEEADLKLGRTIKAFLSADFSGKLSRYENEYTEATPGPFASAADYAKAPARGGRKRKRPSRAAGRTDAGLAGPLKVLF